MSAKISSGGASMVFARWTRKVSGRMAAKPRRAPNRITTAIAIVLNIDPPLISRTKVRKIDIANTFFSAYPLGRLLRPTGGRVLEVLLPPIGCRVEETVGVRERFGPARVGRVRVENVVIEAGEDAQPMLLTLDRDFVPIVVFDGRDLRVKRHVKIVVEIAAKRRKPRDAPSLLRLIGLELGQRGARNHHERCVAVIQHRKAAQGVDHTRTA